MPFRCALVRPLLLLAVPAALAAQNDTTRVPSYSVTSFSAWVPGFENEPVPVGAALGFHWSDVHPARLGAYATLKTMPVGLAIMVPNLALSLGSTLALPVTRDVYVSPRAGVLGIAAPEFFFAGITAGPELLVFAPGSRAGLRAGVSWVVVGPGDTERGLWLAEFGIAWRHGKARGARGARGAP